jgi:hypothetical protein
MNYKAWLQFGPTKEKDPGGGTCVISSFSVVGGASRSINLDSTDDISISSELEQARQYKNITLFMPPTKDHVDMQVAMTLMFAAEAKSTLSIAFIIKKQVKGKSIEELMLGCHDATLISTPYLVAKHLLMIQFRLPTVILYHGKTSRTGVELPFVEM